MLLQERGAHFIAGCGFDLSGGCLIGLLYAPQTTEERAARSLPLLNIRRPRQS
jgi:hypothetical protein